MSRHDVITLLYIVAFSLFIVGLHMLRGPRTAVRGNQIAAVGMAIAVVATLLDQRIGDWGLIVVGVAIGTAVGVPGARAREDDRDAADGGAVQRRRRRRGGADLGRRVPRAPGGDLELEALIPILFAAIIGSISFWGSIIAFLKLQETLKRAFRIPRRSTPGSPAIARRARGGDRRRLGVRAAVLADPAVAPACSACSRCCRSAAPTCRS